MKRNVRLTIPFKTIEASTMRSPKSKSPPRNTMNGDRPFAALQSFPIPLGYHCKRAKLCTVERFYLLGRTQLKTRYWRDESRVYSKYSRHFNCHQHTVFSQTSRRLTRDFLASNMVDSWDSRMLLSFTLIIQLLMNVYQQISEKIRWSLSSFWTSFMIGMEIVAWYCRLEKSGSLFSIMTK